MPTGIGNGIAGDVFQNNLGAGGGGGLVCPSRYSWLGDGVGIGGSWGLMLTGPYNLGATNSSASIWYKPIDIRGATDLGAGLYSTDTGGASFTSGTNIYTSPSGVLTASLGPMIFPAHPELITNGSFSNVPVGAELIANPTFSDAASITPWQITGTPNATIEPWEPRFMRLEYTVAAGAALYAALAQPLNTMYSVKMRVRGVTSGGADQGSAFSSIGDPNNLGQVISNPTLTYDYQDYEFRVWSTSTSFRLYLATAAIGDVVDFDSISIKPITANISNGNFGTGDLTGWSAGSTDDGVTPTAVAAGTGYAAKISNGPLAGNSYISQAAGIVEGKSYKITYRIVSNSSPGTHELNFENYGTVVSTVGTHEFYIVGLLGATGVTVKRNPAQANVDIEVTDLSIEELGADWTEEPGWSIGENKAIANTTGTQQLYQDVSLVNGKSYKITYTIADFVSGIMYLYLQTNGFIGGTAANTTVTHYINYEGTDGTIYFRGSPNVNCSITNITVQEVLSENEWHHLAVSIDRDSEWKWYVDGVLTNTMDNSTDQAPSIGLSSLGLTNVSTSIPSFYGNMTEPSLWNIPLSSSEVKDIYDNMYGGQRCLDILPFSSDLITNGKFNQIGPELILNPNFTDTVSRIENGDFSDYATDPTFGIAFADWSQRADYGGMSAYTKTSEGMRMEITTSPTSSWGVRMYSQNSGNPLSMTDGKSYRVRYSVKGYNTSGSFIAHMDWLNSSHNLVATPSGINATTWTHVDEYVVASYVSGGNPSDGQYLQFWSSDGNVGDWMEVKNVFVEELGADWTAADSGVMSFVEDGLKITAVNYGVGDNRVYQSNVTEDAKSYKYTITIEDITVGCSISIFDGANYINSQSTTGTFYFTRQGTDDSFYIGLFGTTSVSDFVTISSISVQELGQGWTAITANGGTVTFPQGMARIQVDATVGNNAYISQPGVMEIGKSYTMTYRIVSNNGGSLYTSSGVTNPALPSTVGSHEITFTSDNTTLNIARAVDNTDVSITNVTLTQVGGGNLERWWRMNGTEPLLITLPNVAPNGIVNDVVPQNDPLVQPDTP
jgi:hypothetical protein